jgi:hypothetical protein
MDWLWRPDEEFAADREWTSHRSRWGGSITVHNSEFTRRRRLCSSCDGTGHHRITVGACEECDGTGVVTLPDDGDNPDGGGELR